MKTIAARLLACILFGTLMSSAVFAADYHYVSINFPKAILTVARGINARGDVLGDYLDADGVGHDFLLRNGVFTTIEYPGGAAASALAMNARGDIAGNLGDADGSHGFLFRDGILTRIDFPGASFTNVFGINNSGDITGEYGTDAGKTGSFVLRDGVFHTVFAPGGATLARGAQDNGRVTIGDLFMNSDLSTHAFRRGLQDVQLIDPPGTNFPCSHGRGINERGDVAGAFAIVSSPDECDARPPAHGFVLRGDTYDIIDPPGSQDTFVFGINDDGVVVGAATDKNGIVHGFKAVPRN